MCAGVNVKCIGMHSSELMIMIMMGFVKIEDEVERAEKKKHKAYYYYYFTTSRPRTDNQLHGFLHICRRVEWHDMTIVFRSFFYLSARAHNMNSVNIHGEW